ncbi:DUF2157 domain-containing protein [Desulfomicrobium sp. ZS1]|uniref:DUF2157 domain-containing protein n=1 Tax=Desulfomicrobium sp. ZS1 TaxID=2952228 RepID=UPI0020B2764D|nr:DUF2157 domain-containing protein [Desulfomicrobium sp. ZS1]UTF51697.1 DUF2157 domain-containing protein [Desulfomicrobium sp. ZS1]
MDVSRYRLRQAVEKGILDAGQAERLWEFLKDSDVDTPGFRFTHILYYLGGLMAIGAMSLFMTLGWESFGGWGLFGIAVAYALAGFLLAENFLHKRRLPIPAGIIATFVVALTPLAIYGFQEAMGWWAEGRVYRDYHVYIDWRWIFMELGTLAAGVIMLWRYRLPFLVMPVAATLWYMSMDLTPFIFGQADATWELRKLVSLWSGVVIILVALWFDIRTRSEKDYAFWLYIFGVTALWGGLSLMRSDSELNKFLYFCINMLLIFCGAALRRRVFAVFGGLGAAGYLGYLSWNVFKDSLLFPFALTFIGLGVIWMGIIWQRNENAIAQKLRGFLPQPLRDLVDRRG